MTSSKKEEVMLRDLDALRRKIEIISGGTYALTLTTVDPTQVLYNGMFSYLLRYGEQSQGAWCHLLLLRSKQRSSKQLLAILTQTPDCGISLLNWSQHAVTFTMNFFGDIYRVRRREDEDPDELTMTPENTMFVEYLPAGCFGPKMVVNWVRLRPLLRGHVRNRRET